METRTGKRAGAETHLFSVKSVSRLRTDHDGAVSFTY